mgnify:CR=1 FL=1
MDNNQTGGGPVERDPAKQSLLALVNAGRIAELFLCVLEAESNPAIGAAIASWARDYSPVFENDRYVHFLNNWQKEVKQFFLRLKGTKEYKYFRCPSCKNRLRLRRGCGEKHITCPVCKHQFDQKA